MGGSESKKKETTTEVINNLKTKLKTDINTNIENINKTIS